MITVLIVDDNGPIRKMYGLFLKERAIYKL